MTYALYHRDCSFAIEVYALDWTIFSGEHELSWTEPIQIPIAEWQEGKR